MAAIPSVVPAATVSVAVQLVAEEILLTDEADAPAIVTVGVAMASLEVKVIVMTSVSFASVVVELLLAMVTGDNVGAVLSMVKTRLLLPAYAFPATSSPSTVTVWVPSLPAGTSQA